ncbi:MAG: type III-A CRISPR-associated protein Csm2 [Spirochaetia bacterium]|nr:type III-A CRISPR-associated protein Csm2 [Spirochaetia bacterium]
MLKLTKDLLTTEPETIAKKEMDEAKRLKKASSTQIRKFYDDFLLLHSKAHRDGFTVEDFKNEILPLIAFSKAKLAYSMGRGIIHKNFKDEIERKVNLIENLQDFDNFILFYQALIGYTKFYENEKTNDNYKSKKY